MEIRVGNVLLRPEKDGCQIESDGCSWRLADGSLEVDGEKLAFAAADQLEQTAFSTGLGQGVRCRYRFEERQICFETKLWADQASGDVYAEWIPLEGKLDRVCWPGAMAFDGKDPGCYSLLPYQQGLLIPNGWEEPLEKLPFHGQLCSCAAYMPWFGQVRPDGGYIAICQTPWDAGYSCHHPAGEGTELAFYWLPVLGRMEGRRIVRYSFRKGCDYNDLCKIYRQYVRETGLFRSLAEKAARNPKVDALIGAGFVHTGIKTHVSPDSDFYDPADPEKDNHLFTFAQRAELIEEYHQKGVQKLYLHLDGWGQPGYDNRHPDYLPACKEAGGWDGLRQLQQSIRRCGYLYGLHDQYRDYYFAADSFQEEYGVHRADGSLFTMSCWAGGKQSYLCATQAPDYVRRNFTALFAEGLHPDCSYLDVFTCNEPDECSHPQHRMTRRECLEYRKRCFAYLNAHGILPSSEEMNDWAMQELVFCHYAPYDFMMRAPGEPRKGIPVPLFNLVYHDCVIIPWPMDRFEGQEDEMLYALLNGGAAYLQRDPAYMGIDGAFAAGEAAMEENIRRWRIVSELQSRVAKMEMVAHHILEDPAHQQSVFSDGTETVTVTVDLKNGKWEIV